MEVGHRQAALGVLPLPVVVGEGGVDDDAPARPVVDVVDEHPLLDAHLGRGQADAGRVVHGLEHVVGQPAQVGVELPDLERRLPQDRVAERPDGEESHPRRGYPRPLPTPRLHPITPGGGRPPPAGVPGDGRRRPGRRHRTAWSGARTSQRPAAGPSTSTPPRAAKAVDEGRGGLARHGGQGRLRRQAQRRPAGRLHHREAGRVGVEGGVEHLVAGQPGLDQQPSVPPRPARPPAGRPGPGGRRPARRPCGGGPAAPGRSRGRRPHGPPPPGGGRPRCPPGRRRRARPPPPSPAATSATGWPASGSSSSRARVTPAPQGLHPGGAARGAHHRALGPAPAAAQPASAGVGHGSRADLAAGQLPARHARQQRCPALAVEDAHHPPAGRRLPDQGDQPGRVEARPGRLVPAVDDLDDGPAGPLGGAGGRQQLHPGPGQGLERRARRR